VLLPSELLDFGSVAFVCFCYAAKGLWTTAAFSIFRLHELYNRI
jgi:hypothetical protein